MPQIKKALDYKHSYRIAIIGESGSGKSTMLNAMLGRDLLLAREGKAATGAALNIFLNASDANQEKAVIKYRNEANILTLIQEELLDRYKFKDGDGNRVDVRAAKIDEQFLTEFKELKLDGEEIDTTRKQFSKLHKEFVDVVEQFLKHTDLDTEELSLAKESDVDKLRQLIDENSDLNKSGQRKIGTIHSVTYSISPEAVSSSLKTLQLPKNVCLVDLPGLGYNPLHDIIISEGIRDADAVVFILRPPRIELASDKYLLERVKKYISFEGNIESGERIFFVLNAIDQVLSEKTLKDVSDLIERIVPGYTQAEFAKRSGNQPYFMTSALAASLSQKEISGETINDPKLKSAYIGLKETLGVKDGYSSSVLEASQVPKLVEELSKFARERRIERQINDGEIAISGIVDELYLNYEDEKKRKIKKGISSSESDLEYLLDKRKKELITSLRDFRYNLVTETLPNSLQPDLLKKAKDICNQIDKTLKDKKISKIWYDASNQSYYDATSGQYISTNYEQVIGNLEVALWDQLSEHIPELAYRIVTQYESEIKKFNMAQKIEESCLSFVNENQVSEKINECIKTMKETMSEVGRHIALTKVTDPGRLLMNKFAELIHPTIKDIKSDRIEGSNLDEFDPFIKTVRKLYEESVNECVVSLINLTVYETLLIQRELFRYIDTQFRNIRDSKDPTVESKIDNLMNSDPELNAFKILERKLSDISYLKHHSS